MDAKVKEILTAAQDTCSNHQRNVLKLEKIYNESEPEKFNNVLFKYIKHIFLTDLYTQKVYNERTMEFLSKFVCSIANKYEKAHEDELLEDYPSNPLLAYIITTMLKLHDHQFVSVRYHTCKFICHIMRNLSSDLDGDLYEFMEDAMLERLKDPKPNVRKQAVLALQRLQQPQDPNCRSIKGLLAAGCDINAQVRKEVVRVLAPSSRQRDTFAYLEERTRDIDPDVRVAALQRCADTGPKGFRIASRQNILMSSFNDTNKNVHRILTEMLLPKWLSVYNGDYLELIHGITLDADEDDILNTERLCQKIMEAFFKINPIQDFLEVLPLENKLVPVEKLNIEAVTFWSILTQYLRNLEDEGDEYLSRVTPDLTPFCNYIECIIKAKCPESMEKWEYLDFQHTVFTLFEMTDKYDLSDEVGRKTLKALVLSVLQNYTFDFKVVCVLVRLAQKLIPDVGSFTTEMCQVISEIREPLVEKPVKTRNVNSDHEFQMAQLSVKLNILEGQKEEAINNEDYKQAQDIHNQIQEFSKQIDQLTLPKSQSTQKVRESKTDPGTICRCLDILAAVLQTASVKTVTPSLQTVKNEFLMHLMTSVVEEINWRVLKCLTLYCIIDKTVAEANAKLISIPIATYHNDYNKQALITAISGVTDMIRLYGSKIFGCDEPTNGNGNQTTRGRVLYRDEDAIDELAEIDNNLTLEHIVEIILDMLDDENEEIKDAALMAIGRLIMNGFPVSPTLMSRLILKWYNPSIERYEDKLQQKIGWLIQQYSTKVKGAREVIEKAVIPTLNTIANAPSTSPLADIDVDNVIRFLSVLIIGGNGVVHLHGSLAQSICQKIISKPLDSDVPYLTKLLRTLEPPPSEATRKELIKLAELLLEEEYGLDKTSRKHVMQYITGLNNFGQNNEAITVTTSANTSVYSTINNGTRADSSAHNEAGASLNTTKNSCAQNGVTTTSNPTANSSARNETTHSFKPTANSTTRNLMVLLTPNVVNTFGSKQSLNPSVTPTSNGVITSLNSTTHNGEITPSNQSLTARTRRKLSTSTPNGRRMTIMPSIQEKLNETYEEQSKDRSSSVSTDEKNTYMTSRRKKARLEVDTEKIRTANSENRRSGRKRAGLEVEAKKNEPQGKKAATGSKNEPPKKSEKLSKKRQRRDSPSSQSDVSSVSTRSRTSRSSDSSQKTDVSVISATTSTDSSNSQPGNTLRRSFRKKMKKGK